MIESIVPIFDFLCYDFGKYACVIALLLFLISVVMFLVEFTLFTVTVSFSLEQETPSDLIQLRVASISLLSIIPLTVLIPLAKAEQIKSLWA